MFGDIFQDMTDTDGISGLQIPKTPFDQAPNLELIVLFVIS